MVATSPGSRLNWVWMELWGPRRVKFVQATGRPDLYKLKVGGWGYQSRIVEASHRHVRACTGATVPVRLLPRTCARFH